MKKIVFLMVMMLAIAGMYAHTVDTVDATYSSDLKKDYFMVRLTFTHGTAPFDIMLNNHHVDQYHLICSYDTNNVIIITDANNTSKTLNIYEPNPHFMWGISYFDWEYTGISGTLYKKTGISIGCSFDDRYNFDIEWYNVSDYTQIGFGTDYEPVPDSIWTYLRYQADHIPVGIYSVKIRDTVHDMDTVVFVEITDPGSTTDTTTTDTTTTDTTTTDTTQHLTINITEKIDNVSFYPNPTDNVCNISEILREIYILDYMGRRLRKITHTNKIDLAGLPAGIYILEYVRQNGTKDKVKIVKRI